MKSQSLDGSMRKGILTQRVPDLGYAPRFLAFSCLARTPVSRAHLLSHQAAGTAYRWAALVPQHPQPES